MLNYDELSPSQLRDALKESNEKIDQLQTLLTEGGAAEPGRQLRGSALKESEERYHKMVEEVEDYAILMLNREGLIQNWNKGAEKIKGYTEAEVLGRHFRIFYPQKDQEDRLPEKLIAHAILEGKAVHEGWRIRKDGSQFWGSIVITALHDDDNEIIAFSKVTRDLTERKATEDKLLSYTRRLESQNSQLQQFAYAAAHDMKEPLRKIQLYLSAIIDESQELSPARKLTYLQNSAEAAQRMQGLIEDLLAFAKVSEPSHALEPVDLNELLQEAVNFYQETSDTQHVSISADRLPVIKGIPFQIRQLLQNLLGNALKYRHPERAPVIKIWSGQVSLPDIESRIHRDKSFYIITFQDNGIGFDPRYNEKIFEIFERLHTRENYAGTGIGLAICKKIVENHGGKIMAEGHEQEGARFDLYFPIDGLS